MNAENDFRVKLAPSGYPGERHPEANQLRSLCATDPGMLRKVFEVPQHSVLERNATEHEPCSKDYQKPGRTTFLVSGFFRASFFRCSGDLTGGVEAILSCGRSVLIPSARAFLVNCLENQYSD